MGEVLQRIVEIAVFKILKARLKINIGRVFMPSALDACVNGLSLSSEARLFPFNRPGGGLFRAGFLPFVNPRLVPVFIDDYDPFLLIVDENLFGKQGEIDRNHDKKTAYAFIEVHIQFYYGTSTLSNIFCTMSSGVMLSASAS